MSSLPAAVLWDLDGTLIDTEPYWIACEYELVEEFGGRWTDADAHSIIGYDLLNAAAIIRDRGGVNLPPAEIVERLCAGVIARIREHMPWRPGAQELLAALNRAGVPCALVTMSWRNIAEAVLARIPADAFGVVVTGDMVANGKPHPEPYRRAAAELGVDPLSCVAIEDSPTGVRSAEAAGCVVVAVAHMVAIPHAPHRVSIETLVGITPQDLGAFVETTPPPTSTATHDARLRHRMPQRPDSERRAGYGRSAGPTRAVSRGEQRAWNGNGALLARRRRLAALAAVAAVLIAGIGVWWIAIRDTGPRYDPGAFNVHTWAPSWELENSTPRLEEHFNLFHQVSPFWYHTVGVGTIEVIEGAKPEETDKFLGIARDRGVPVVASIVDGTASGTMAGIIADDQLRAQHIETVAEFAATNDFDGIDLDYENFAFKDERSTWPDTRKHFVTFVRELSERLAADGRILVISVPPIYDTGTGEDSGFWVYDYGELIKHVESLRIMAYDFSYAGGSPGPISPLPWVETSIEAATDAAGGPEKLVLGIPMFGYNWVVGTTGTCPDDVEGNIANSLTRALSIIEREDVTPTYNEENAESTFTYRNEATSDDGSASCTQSREVHFLDSTAIKVRMQLSIDRGLKGVSLYAFGYEDPAVFADIASINETLESTVPEQA